MFNKRRCARCGKKSSKSYQFCPHCGNTSRIRDPKEYGLLGEDDRINELNEFSNLFNNFGGAMLGKMLAGTMKMLEKEMMKEMSVSQTSQKKNSPKQIIPSNMQLFINGKKVDLKPQEQPLQKTKKIKQKVQVRKYLTESTKEKSIKLPQEEPNVEIKRLSNSILYELNIPGVKSMDDISIVQLENSIEIKAIAKDKIYSKTMKISLPIISYELNKDKLILELEGN